MRKRKLDGSSNKRSLVSEGPRFPDWSYAEKELLFLHAELCRDLFDPKWGSMRRRSLEAFRPYTTCKFEEYLLRFDEFSETLMDCVQGRTTVSHLCATIEESGNLPLAREVERLLQHLTQEDFFRNLASIFAFPLRFDRPGAEANFERLVRVNKDRPCYRPSIELVSVCESFVNDLAFKATVEAHFAPSHGPGSVTYMKRDRTHTGRLPLVVKDSMINTSILRDLIARGGWDYPSHLLPEQSGSPILPSQVIAVPKSWKKKRLIAIEDVTLQYYEQGVRRALYAGLREHELLREVIDLEHPEENARLAQFASLTGAYATVDLSDASDSVGYRFVETCFQGTWLWPKIREARSAQLQLPDSRVLTSNMFATMGNAICFPVECIVFAAICVEALMLSGRTYVDAFKHFRVYGDDIVIASDAVPVLLRKLKAYGFTPNERKTFTTGTFRESCGGEYLRGRDVTPVRISRRFSGEPESKNSLQWEAWFELANRFGDFGCRSARRAIIARLLTKFSEKPAFSDDGSIGLKTDSAVQTYREGTNYDCFHCQRYQSEAFVVDALVTSVRRVRRDTAFALIEWASHAEERPDRDEPIETSSCEKTSTARRTRRAYLVSTRQLLSFEALK